MYHIKILGEVDFYYLLDILTFIAVVSNQISMTSDMFLGMAKFGYISRKWFKWIFLAEPFQLLIINLCCSEDTAQTSSGRKLKFSTLSRILLSNSLWSCETIIQDWELVQNQDPTN